MFQELFWIVTLNKGALTNRNEQNRKQHIIMYGKIYVLSTMIKQARNFWWNFQSSHCRIFHSFFNLICNIPLIDTHAERDTAKVLIGTMKIRMFKSIINSYLSSYLKELPPRRPKWIISQVSSNLLPNQPLP